MNLRKMKRRMLLLIASITLISVILLMQAVESQGPMYGGTFIKCAYSEPQHLNPILNRNYFVENPAYTCVYQTLLWEDFNGTLRPQLAESWNMSPDGKTYTFNLVRNATFHDGTPFTVQDALFSFGKWIELHAIGQLVPISYLEAADNYTLVIHLKYVYPTFLFTLVPSDGPPMFPKHLWEGTDFAKNPYNLRPVGTGPFKFVEWVTGDHMTFERYDNYWKEGLPYLNGVIFKFISDDTMRLIALETGQVDMIDFNGFPFSQIDSIKANPDLQVFSGVNLFGTTRYIFCNLMHPILKNVQVRQALAYAIDTKYMMDKSDYGLCPPASSALGIGVKPYWTDDVPKYPHDPDKANKLLDEAGYPEGPDGVRFSLSIIYESTFAPSGTDAVIMKEELKNVGINLNIRPMETASFISTTFVNHDFDLFIEQVATGMNPDVSWARFLLWSSYLKAIPYVNPTGYNDSQVGAWFNNVSQEPDLSKRIEIYHNIQTKVMEDLPMIPLGYFMYPHVWSVDFANVLYDSTVRCSWDTLYWKKGSEASPTSASAAIQDASTEIDRLQGQGYAVEAALAKLADAEAAYQKGDYVSAMQLGKEARTLPVPPWYIAYGLYIGAAVVIVIVAVVAGVWRRRRKKH